MTWTRFSAPTAQRDYRRHAERSKLVAFVLDKPTDRLMSLRDPRGVQHVALGVGPAMRGEATDWYSVVPRKMSNCRHSAARESG